MAILHHEQDYPESTAEEKKEYHQYCGTWCECKMWENQKKPLKEFTRTKTKNIHGEDVVWEGGILGKLKLEHPEAFKELLPFLKSWVVRS